MKKLLLLSIALLIFSVPALAFSISHRVEATYRVSLGDGWDVGVQGQLRLAPNSQPPEVLVAIGILVRPYIRYITDLVDEDQVSLSAYLRARLPWEASNLVPAPAQRPTFSLTLQAGLDFSYDLSKQLGLTAGLELELEFARNIDYALSGFTELNYALEHFDLYSGLSLDEILPGQAFTLYLGLSKDLTSIVSVSLEGGYGFGTKEFSLTSGISFRFR